MTKKIIKVIWTFLIFLLIITGCSLKEEKIQKPIDEVGNGLKEPVLENVNQYDIDVQFYPKKKLIEGGQRVVYVNNEDVPMEKIYFHLYPNAFKKKERAPFLFEDLSRAYPKGFSEGYIDIKEVYIEGVKASYSIHQSDETIMEVSLPDKLDIGNKISIDMKYTVKLPRAAERFGYGEDTYNLGNWYPIIAVYDDSGWNLDPYYPIGDPFYSDISDYRVNIKTPKDFIVASTGNTLSNELIDNAVEWKIQANAVRDFAWVASRHFEVVEREVDGTLLKMYFLNNQRTYEEIENRSIEFAEKSLKTFNKIFGKYPYKEYSVVQTNFPSGMEYPGIVFIGNRYYDTASINYLEIVIVHETAHQWWYGVVGNDQIDEAWLDESLASYSEVIYVAENYGEERGRSYHKEENEESFYRRVDSLEDKTILKSLKDFRDWNNYGALVYTKGTLFLDDIKDKYGKDMLYRILRTYYDRYRFEIATTEDFLNICEEITGDNLDDYFEKWLK